MSEFNHPWWWVTVPLWIPFTITAVTVTAIAVVEHLKRGKS